MTLDFNQFLNPYDISFLIVLLISIFFGIKNGIIKSFFNLIKWTLIYFSIKNCFSLLRPFFDPYISNQTVSDIIIFLITLTGSYIILSTFNRVIIGILQPKKSGLLDFGFGAVLGIIRGYIIFVLIIFFINTNFSVKSLSIVNNGAFQGIVNYGINFLEHMPRKIEKINDIGSQI